MDLELAARANGRPGSIWGVSPRRELGILISGISRLAVQGDEAYETFFSPARMARFKTVWYPIPSLAAIC